MRLCKSYHMVGSTIGYARKYVGNYPNTRSHILNQVYMHNDIHPSTMCLRTVKSCCGYMR